MKMKFLSTTLLVMLAFTAIVSAHKLRRVEEKTVQPVSVENSDVKANEAVETKETETKEINDKEVHKRGVFYNGFGGLSSHSGYSAAAYLPRTYASHYGYNLHLPGAAAFSSSAYAHAPSVGLKYHPIGTHFKTGFAGFPATTAYHSAGLLPHAHFAHAPETVTAFAAPVVHSAPAPVPVAAPAPVPVAAPAPAPAVVAAPVHTSYVLRPGGAVVSSYNVNYPQQHYQKPAIAIQQFNPVAAVSPGLVPLQAYRPPVQPVQPVQPIHHPVQPIHHQFVQTTFLQQPAAVPAAPVIPAAPAIPAAPVIPAAPPVPTFSVQPTFPVFSTFPAVPSVPAQPATPVFPAAPQPRPFIPQPAAVPQFPVSPLPGQPTPPDTGSAVASPQIPPPAAPEPELPPQPTQASWKPVADRPSITLMPPYGAPGEAYLPPAPSSQQLQQQQLSSSLFDNLTEAEIEHIFSQAAQAQQQHQRQQQINYHQHRNAATAYQHHY